MKQEITQLLGWTELEYNQFIYDTGIAYLHQYIPDDRPGIAALERSRIFWNWWKNHWIQRDMQFVHKTSGGLRDARRYYCLVHNVKRLIGTIYPNAVILHESYATMINEFNKEVVYG